MKKIIFIVLMSCTACIAQNTDPFIIGQWYLADGCIPKTIGAWATYPTGSTKFCFTKTKSTGHATEPITNANNIFIENVCWTFSSGKKGNLLVCEYVKDLILNVSSTNGKITNLETKEFASYKNKYYWTYDSQTEVLNIFTNKTLNILLVAFKIDNKVNLTLIKQS